MILRDYQSETLPMVKAEFERGNRKVIVHLATGSGKGLIMSHIVNKYVNAGMKVLTIMRRRDVVFQTQNNYKRYHGIESSIIMGGDSTNDKCLSVIASIDTLYRRERIEDYNCILVDECHDTTSKKYREVLNLLDNCNNLFIGFTATPWAIGNKGHDWWDTSVRTITPSELRDRDYLVPVRTKVPETIIDTTNVRVVLGDYHQGDLERAASVSVVLEGVVDNYKRYAIGKRAIAFCVNISHSKVVCNWLNKAGIRAVHADQSSSKEDREDALSKLTDGEIDVLCNVNIFSTGVDIPSLCVALILRPTKSRVLWVQQIGRIVRPFPEKKEALVIDHTENTQTLGDIYENERPANFDKKPDKIAVGVSTKKRCPECCELIPVASSVCPICGSEFENLVAESVGEMVDYVPKPLKVGSVYDVVSVSHEDFTSKAGNKGVVIEYATIQGKKIKEYITFLNGKNVFNGYAEQKLSRRMEVIYDSPQGLKIQTTMNGKWENVKKVWVDKNIKIST